MDLASAVDAADTALNRRQLLKHLTPYSVDEVRRELVEASVAHRAPSFDWTLPTADVAEIDELEMIAARVEQVAPRYANAVRNRAEVLRCSGIDSARFQAWSDGRYGIPAASVIGYANELLSEAAAEPAATISSAELADRCRRSLDNYELHQWQVVVVDSIAARMSVGNAKVRVRANEWFSEVEVRRLLVHEIGTHVLRRANGDLQSDVELLRPPIISAASEEGLAVWHEHMLGVASAATLRRYAARVLAAVIARTEGIIEVMRNIAPYVGAAAAADIAIRVKRGFADPHGPGSFTKDISYLAGYLDASRVIRSSGVHALLMSARLPFDELPTLERARATGQLVIAQRLPDLQLLGIT